MIKLLKRIKNFIDKHRDLLTLIILLLIAVCAIAGQYAPLFMTTAYIGFCILMLIQIIPKGKREDVKKL